MNLIERQFDLDGRTFCTLYASITNEGDYDVSVATENQQTEAVYAFASRQGGSDRFVMLDS